MHPNSNDVIENYEIQIILELSLFNAEFLENIALTVAAGLNTLSDNLWKLRNTSNIGRELPERCGTITTGPLVDSVETCTCMVELYPG